MFRSKLKVTKKSPRGAPSKAKKKKDISSYFVAPIPRQPSHPNFSQGSQSFQQFCSVSQSNTQQLHVSASMNNSAGDFVFRGNGNAKTNKRINFNDSQGGTRLFSSGSQAGGGNENAMPSLSQGTDNNFSQPSNIRNKLVFSQTTSQYNASQLAFMSQSQTQLSQDDGGYALSTPLDQPAQAINTLRSPSPLPKKKSRHSVLSPHGLDDLRREADNLVSRAKHANAGSQLENDEFTMNGLVVRENRGQISSTPGASQDDLSLSMSELNSGVNLFRNTSKSKFRAGHLNSCEKENYRNRSSDAPKAPSRRRRRSLAPVR